MPTREIRTEILVKAPASVLWEVLTDLSAYETWNPFVYPACGRIEPGAVLDVRAHPPGLASKRFAPVVTRLEEGRAFAWVGYVLAPWAVRGEHVFELTPEDEGVRLLHREVFTGLFAALVFPLVARGTKQGFEDMNREAKRRAETLARERGAGAEDGF